MLEQSAHYVRKILTVAAQSIGIDVQALIAVNRRASVARARLIAMMIARERTGFSLPELGSFFNRDHSTILCGVRRAQKAVVSDTVWASHYASIMSELDGKAMRIRMGSPDEPAQRVRVAL